MLPPLTTCGRFHAEEGTPEEADEFMASVLRLADTRGGAIKIAALPGE